MITRTRFLRARHRAALTALAALAALGLGAAPLAAQLIRVPMPGDAARPLYGSVSVGYLLTSGRFDGVTGTYWSLSDAIQYRGTVELGTRSGAIGLTGTIATLPVVFDNNTAAQGDIQLRQLLLTFRSPEGNGFYQIFEAGAGLSQWASYSGGAVLTSSERAARNGAALMIGYGFGFALGDNFSFNVVQDGSTIIGSAKGMPAGQRRSQNQYITRMGLRYRFRGTR